VRTRRSNADLMKKGLRQAQPAEDDAAGLRSNADLMKKGLRHFDEPIPDHGNRSNADLMKKGLRPPMPRR